jgi:hypothetical protein
VRRNEPLAHGAALEGRVQWSVPNPVVGAGAIQWTQPGQARVRLSIYDVRGRRIAKLFDDALPPGTHEAAWSPVGRAPGVYFAVLEVGRTVLRTKVVVLE